MSGCAEAGDCEGALEVPERLDPVRVDDPQAGWRVVGPFALPGMVLLWISPARVGKHLERAGWGAAILAHLFGLAVGWGFFWWCEAYTEHHPFGARAPMFPAGWGMSEPDFVPPSLSLWEYVRAPFAVIAIDLHRADPTVGSRWPYYLAGLGAVEVAMLVLAVALMPYAAAGEPAKRLFGRCLRLTWWSTSLFALGGVLTLPYLWARGHWVSINEWHAVDALGAAVFASWWMLIWLRSGYGYAGVAEGPAWAPRTPHCEGCGYNIGHLSKTGNCPECGRPVAESLPERRQLTSFATARGLLKKFNALRFTMRDAVFDASFFDRLSVTGGHARARSFFFAVCWVVPLIVITLVVALVFLLAISPEEELAELIPGVIAAVAFGVACFVGQVLLVGITCGVVAGLDRREVRTVATVAFHASSFLLLLIIGIALGYAAGGLGVFAVFLDLGLGYGVVLLLVGVVFAGIGVWCVVRALKTLRRALVRTRWANG